MDIAARRDVVIIPDDLGLDRNAAEFVLFFPVQEGRRDALDSLFGNEVLGIAFGKDLRGVDQEQFVFFRLELVLVEEKQEVLRAANTACRVPKPGFERFGVWIIHTAMLLPVRSARLSRRE